MGLRTNNYFIGKIQQIYETMKVRHGFMVVGNSLGGKSSGLKVLARALGIMNSRVSLGIIRREIMSFQ